MRLPTYFGHVESVTSSSSHSEVRIFDCLSEVFSTFTAPVRITQISSTVGLLFALTEEGILLALDYAKQTLHQVSLHDAEWQWSLLKAELMTTKWTPTSYEHTFEDRLQPITATTSTPDRLLCCALLSAYVITNDFVAQTSTLSRVFCGRNGSPPNMDQRLEYTVMEVTAGNDFVVLLDQLGQVHTFGSSNHGELGHGSFDAVSEPQKVMFFEEAEQVVTQISAGKWHTAVLTESGDVYAWGWNRSGQLGHSSDGSACASMQDTPYPMDVEQEAVAVHCIEEMTLVRLANGDVLRFGRCCTPPVG